VLPRVSKALRRGRLLLAAGICACLAAGCSTVNPGGLSKSTNTVTFAYSPGEDFTWLFPIENAANAEPWDWDVESYLWLPLYAQGDGSAPVFDYRHSLGEKPVWSDHNQTVSVTLKHYRWSDGTPVTSRDVEFWFNLERWNKTKDNSYTPGQLPDDVKSVDYPSKYRFVVHLKRSYSEGWFDENQLSWITPMPQHVWDRESLGGKVGNYDRTEAGAKAVFSFLYKQSSELSTYASNPIWKTVDGPFRLTGYAPTTYETTLEPNPQYTGPDKPRIHKFVIESFLSNTAEIDALRSGTVTYGYLTADDYAERGYLEHAGFTVKEWVPQYTQWAELGYTSKTYGPLVRQHYIRQALQHLVNQNLYVKTALHGLGQLTYGPVPNTPHNPFVSPEEKTDPDPYSPTAARKLLMSNGWSPGAGGYMVCTHPGFGAGECGAGIAKGRQLQISLMYETEYPTLLAQVETFVQAAKSAGIDMTLDPQGETTMFSIGGTCPPGPCNWGMQIYADWMWNYGEGALYPSGDSDFSTGNYWAGGYTSPTANKLINAERYHTGLKHVYAFENYISRQVAAVWFPTVQTWSIVENDLKGWNPQNPFGYPEPQLWHFSKS
jgi:peptide/nickel transport system substrate-binding protein